ncbi:MAG: NUDIX hydrolase [Patescibacteria group bacterium]
MRIKPLVKVGRPVELTKRFFGKAMVRQSYRRRNNGTIEDYYFFGHSSQWASIVFPLTPTDEVVAIRQFRPAVGKAILELPGGTLEDEATPEIVARQELTEETGYVARELLALTPQPIFIEPANTALSYHLYLATGCLPTGEQSLSPTEDIEVVLMPLRTWIQKIRRGHIQDGRSIVATFLALPHLKAWAGLV